MDRYKDIPEPPPFDPDLNLIGRLEGGNEHIEQATAAPGEVRPIKPRCITSDTLGKQLIDAGILPAYTKRFIIDGDTRQVLKIYVECFGDDRILTIGMDAAFRDAEVIRANDVEG